MTDTQSDTQTNRTLTHSRFFAPVIVLLAAALVVGVSGFVQVAAPKASEEALTVEPIGSAVLLCPEPGTGGDLGVRVTAAVVPGQPGQDVGEGSRASSANAASSSEFDGFGCPVGRGGGGGCGRPRNERQYF